MTAALDLAGSLRLEDGRRWGEAATADQWADVSAVLDGDGPPYHFLTRARGYSKSTDLAAVAVGLMVAGLPAGARLYGVAADRDQGRLLIDSIAGFVARTPGLAGLVTVDAFKASTASGTTLEILAADAAGAWGLRPSFVIVDEIAQWASTSGPRRLWEAVTSALAKVDGARLVCLTSAGDPAHWSHKVLTLAKADPLWRVHEVAGPPPWADPARLAEQRRRLPESMYRRLFENEWSAAEDRLVAPDDLAACVTLSGPQDPVDGVRYVVGLDLGLKRDRTVAAIAHSEPLADGREGRRVVLDRMEVWQGSRLRPVELGDVEAWLGEASRRYNGAPIVADPWQAVGLLQRLRDRRVRVEEFAFSAQSVGRLASELLVALRDRRLALPDDPDLLDELGTVRLRETSPGVLRMDHDADGHDDRAIALALAVNWLGEHSQPRSRGRVVYPRDPPGSPPAQVALAAAVPGRFAYLGGRGLQELFPTGRRGR